MDNRKQGLKSNFLLLFLFFMCFTYSQAQSQSIRGKVTDINNEPLIGVNVVEQGTTNGTVTDVDGNFTLTAKENSTIVFSYIGFQTQQVQCKEGVNLNIILLEDSELLGEIVVVGYGTQRKINLSGAVDQVGVKELEAKPINNISQGLQGMIPNLNIDFTSGEPGQAARINVRGLTSINGGSPLILIDGIAWLFTKRNLGLAIETAQILWQEIAQSIADLNRCTACGRHSGNAQHGETHGSADAIGQERIKDQRIQESGRIITSQADLTPVAHQAHCRTTIEAQTAIGLASTCIWV